MAAAVSLLLFCVDLPAADLKYLFDGGDFKYTDTLRQLKRYWQDRELLDWIRDCAQQRLEDDRFPLAVPERCSWPSRGSEEVVEAWSLARWQQAMMRLGARPHRDHQGSLLRLTIVGAGFTPELRKHLGTVVHPQQQLSDAWRACIAVRHVEERADLPSATSPKASVLLLVLHSTRGRTLHVLSHGPEFSVGGALDALTASGAPLLIGLVCCALDEPALKELESWTRKRANCHVVLASKPDLLLGQLAEAASREMAQLTEAVACMVGADASTADRVSTDMVMQLAAELMPRLTRAGSDYLTLLFTPEGSRICLSSSACLLPSAAVTAVQLPPECESKLHLGPYGQRHVLSGSTMQQLQQQPSPSSPPLAEPMTVSLPPVESSSSIAVQSSPPTEPLPSESASMVRTKIDEGKRSSLSGRASDSVGKVRKERTHCKGMDKKKQNKSKKKPCAQLRAVKLVAPAELAVLKSSLPGTVQNHLAAETLMAYTAEVSVDAACLGRCTLLFTCLSMCGSSYRNHTINHGRDLKPKAKALAGAFSPPEAPAALYPKPLADAAWLLHDVSSADAEELLRLFCVSTKRQPPASLMLGTKSRKVFVRTAAARVPCPASSQMLE